ncbi:MAG: PspA/IM30 family protein [Myxococcota bacterium]|nr:PspA/IM30 family protein [Myxococcota bacterium]
MSFGNRMFNLWKGFLGVFATNLEQQNPEIAYENAINSLTERYQDVKGAAAGLLKRRDAIESKLERSRRDLARVIEEIDTAVELNDDDSALILIKQQEELEQEISESEGDLELAAKEAEEAKASLRKIQQEIESLKNERDRTIAQIKDAEARHRIQNQLDGISVDDEVRALENVREYAEKIRAEVKISDELRRESSAGRLDQIREKTAENRAASRLAALKEARKQSQS